MFTKVTLLRAYFLIQVTELHQNQRRLHAQRQDSWIGKEGKKEGKKEGGMGRGMGHEAEWEERKAN